MSQGVVVWFVMLYLGLMIIGNKDGLRFLHLLR